MAVRVVTDGAIIFRRTSASNSASKSCRSGPVRTRAVDRKELTTEAFGRSLEGVVLPDGALGRCVRRGSERCTPTAPTAS